MAMLLATDEVCACDVSDSIGKSPATTSHHLSLLRKAGLITGDKRGTWIWYRAVPERLEAIARALALKA
jgi:ArsR family transcriptional regulator